MPLELKPATTTEYPKYVAQHIWEIEPGCYTYSDETEDLVDEVYTSIEDAQTALENYAHWLNHGPDQGEITCAE